MWKLIAGTTTRIVYLGALFFYFCYKIAASGWLVGWSVLRGYRGDNGAMVEYRHGLTSEWGLVLLFNLISMTPGSLSVDISDDRRVIEVHLLDISGSDEFYAVTSRIEGMIKRIFA
ncbi:MAG: Na+/H+ antiporter subunit E [Bacteroidales bacterium]|jgi:multicomponent Na+:H+ antiporter subunit E|nr:Na+/H+ antiporter subunit E [Bacteroidales bacterium]